MKSWTQQFHILSCNNNNNNNSSSNNSYNTSTLLLKSQSCAAPKKWIAADDVITFYLLKETAPTFGFKLSSSVPNSLSKLWSYKLCQFLLSEVFFQILLKFVATRVFNVRLFHFLEESFNLCIPIRAIKGLCFVCLQFFRLSFCFCFSATISDL